ncbi:hypothetical protein O1L60_14280 [Streptomyces diastatochromogenes]|nr:hypothetical protein [Streptomyces diastatochromogenes]
MRLDSVPADGGGGGGASDYKVTSADLKAIGNEAQELYHWFESVQRPRESWTRRAWRRSTRPGTAYATAPGWSRDASNDLEELMNKYSLDSRLHGHDNNLPDPYKKK